MTPFAFLSHRGTDKPRIRPFVEQAVERGIPVWIDRPEELNCPCDDRQIRREDLAGYIPEGASWPLSIDEAIYSAGAVVVFWSAAWIDNLDILLREFTIGHSGANVGRTRYFPAFLDPIAALPPRIVEIRRNVHDTVQGYDVSTSNAPQWSLLLDDLVSTLARSKDKPAVPPDGGGARISGNDWGEVLADLNRSIDSLLKLVAALPPGPAVDAMVIPFELRVHIAGALSDAEAAGVLAQAAEMVLATFPPAMRRKRHTLVVLPAFVPSPLKVAAIDYWDSVFNSACLMGPRMLGALLLSIRPLALHGRHEQVAGILRRLEAEAWEVENDY
jgi:hypothetical protein